MLFHIFSRFKLLISRNNICKFEPTNTYVFLLMIRRPPRSTQSRSSAASDVYKRQVYCLDVKELGSILNEKFDICLVDTFPGVDTNYFEASIREICGEIIII